MPPSSSAPLAASIIIPAYNEARTLSTCLRALAAQTIASDWYEVIVVDDGSTDGTAEIAAGYGVLVLRQKHQGAAAARNRGAQHARNPILLFTDADCEPLPDWIEQMLVPFADPKVAGVKGAYRTRQQSWVARFTQAEYEEKYARLGRSCVIDFVDTYAAGYRRDLFLAAGGFDSSFPSASVEDQELSYRLASEGHRLIFAPTARVYHQHPATVGRYARRKFHLGRWKVRVLLRHPAKAVHDSYTPWTQKAQLALLPLTLGAAMGTLVGLVSWIWPLSLAMLGLATAIPLLNQAVHLGWPVVFSSPFLLLVRALALDLGLAWGTVSELVLQLRGRSGSQR